MLENLSLIIDSLFTIDAQFVDWVKNGFYGATICLGPMVVMIYRHMKKRKALAAKAKARRRRNIYINSVVKLDRMGY